MNRLLVALTLCFSGVCLASPQVYKLTDEDMAVINKSQEILRGDAAEEGLDIPRFDIKLSDFTNKDHMRQAQSEAKQVAEQVLEKHSATPMLNADLDFDFEPDGQTPKPKPYTDHSTLVFASLSLGEQGLKELLSYASKTEGSVVVFRGIPRDESMTVALTRLQKLAAQHKPMPTLIIDPDLFRSYSVDVVPTIVSVDANNLPIAGDPAQAAAKVAGISDPFWLEKAIERGEAGDLGIKGPVEAISEVDLIELAKERVVQIDWEEKKKAALANFWHKQKFLDLPRATKQRTRIFDPSIQITQDIQAPDGTYIARLGDIINPLDIRAFTQAVIIYDPTDKQQVELVLEAVPALKENPSIGFISYIATRIDPIEGWKSYEKITDTVDEHVSLLTPDVVQRFGLEYVPSIITSGGKVFHITELAKAQ